MSGDTRANGSAIKQVSGTRKLGTEAMRYFAATGSTANGQEAFLAGVRRLSKRQFGMTTIVLLLISNIFMTFAWYGHLKYGHGWPIWQAIAVSWGIALFEYCLAVPANRLGYGEFTGFQLKIIQEVATLVIFVAFAVLFLKEKFAWNYAAAFVCLAGAAYFAFAFKPPAA